MAWAPTFDFSRSPVGYAYMAGRELAEFIVGPVGSGKTFASLLRPWILAQQQAPAGDGVRYTRFLVVRNTMPELRSTTIATWENLFPAEHCGAVIYSSPARHHFRRRPKGGEPGLDVETLFLALDKPRDVKKLLSLEATGIYFNELREIPEAIVKRSIERVGRYRIDSRPSTFSGIWGDTNPPDTDHYLYRWDREETPRGFRFHHQPPAVLEVEMDGGVPVCVEPEYRGHPFVEHPWRPGEPMPVIPAAGRLWVVNPSAENLHNLAAATPNADPLGPDSYYGRSLGAMRLEEIQCYYQGRYVFLAEGRPVVPEYSDQMMAAEHLPVLPDVPLTIGLDFGLTPAAAIMQRHPRGTWMVHRELVTNDMGIDRFGDLLVQELAQHFPDHWPPRDLGGTSSIMAHGDPAGEKRDELFEVTAFTNLRSKGIPCKAAPSQDPQVRLQAIRTPCTRLVDGRPGLLVNKAACPILRKGLMGGWHYRKLQVTGEIRYASEPAKNSYSHICEAAGYGLLGGGEMRALRGRPGWRGGRTIIGPAADFRV